VAVKAGQPLTVTAQKTVAGSSLVGVAANVTPIPGGNTNAGVLTLSPACGARFVDGLFPGTGVSGESTFDTGFPGDNEDHRTVGGMLGYDDGSGPALYAWGDFWYAGGQAVFGVAKWDGTRWQQAWPLTGTVAGMLVADLGSGPTLYLYGSANLTYHGVPLNGLAQWPGTTWSAVGNGTDGDVSGLALVDDGAGPALYVTGDFHNVNYATLWNGQQEGMAAPGAARWNGSAWTALAATGNGNFTNFVIADSRFFLPNPYPGASPPSTSNTRGQASDPAGHEWRSVPRSPTAHKKCALLP
jgi:hypothetical protein